MLKKMFKSFDYPLIFAIILLCGFGLIMVYSSSMISAVSRFNFESDFFFKRQAIFLAAGFFLFTIMAIFPYKALANKAFQKFLLLGSIMFLFLLFVFGHTAGGAKSWFQLFGFQVQPGEFVKLSLIIYLSYVYSKKQSYIDQLGTGIAPPAIVTVVICTLVAVQPDFGTAVIIGTIAMSMILCSGLSGKGLFKLVMLSGLVILLISPVIFFNLDNILTGYRLSRIESFQNPFRYADSSGLQVVNSYLAIGSGGLFGLGLGESVQKYGFLPEAHTDFIMAIIAEELGIFGVLFVIFLLAFVVLKGFYIARKCQDPFGSLLAIGISSMIAIQSFINLGGVCGLIPVTGVTLPFISYGGSSLLLLLISSGILVNISMFTQYFEKNKKKAPIHKEMIEKKQSRDRFRYENAQ
ncbi:MULTISPECIES: putative lipid II flippase FtsW [Bacillus]|uniref:Probable peptidoglycan glycosyltransferase FtsW n=2 Tax=Bacillus TaxID=1386 RepID=A0A0M3R975_9BACI|nr:MULTISPECIES: putative lipid II flippase FtsW [Bacillus]ALC80936.1 cell division protein FtsW [Bacillus gobiensis]MBP1079884.1 cell division protein FtsW [Bacillus capparidis]MED1095271.1 putative lipid II flippase FtsW [Bacillus capparidis]